VILLAVAAAGAWRPLVAWWDDDAGNRALARGQTEKALSWFDRSLRWEPRWRLLHEDRGRALQASDPAAAVAEFDYAGCGAPCDAEAGDALLRMGKVDEAVDRYVRAHAAERVFSAARDLARTGHDDAAMGLVRLLIAQLHDNFLERSDLASSYAALGSLELEAAGPKPRLASALRAQAIADFARASRLSPFNEGYLLSYASAEERFGDRRAARRAYERILQLHPGEPNAQEALRALHDAPDPAATSWP
jgi:tetratricopeptide (TPR) repeat protein